MKQRILKLSIILLMISVNAGLSAKIQLPLIFTDNMVLQQQTDAPIWGKATPDKDVKIVTSWDRQTYNVKADAKGDWKIYLKTPQAGGPYQISISDGKELVLKNVLIGEVWICSGQSNMEMPVAGWGKVNNFEQEVASANYPQIRLFHVEQATSLQPLEELRKTRGGWQQCSPNTIPEFSAVSYFFGRNLHQTLNVPIGLISTSWGGTTAEAWTSASALELMPDFNKEVLQIKNVSDQEAQAMYEKDYAQWNDLTLKADDGYNNETPVWASQKTDDTSWNEMQLPNEWESQGLENLDGIVWFRKTFDVPSAWAGKDLVLKLAMIDDHDITFFNGHQIATGSGYNTERVYTIPGKIVKPGKSVITVRVTDTGGGGGIHGDPQSMYICPRSKKEEKSVSLSGNWKYKVAIDFDKHPKAPQSVIGNSNRPTVLFNAMINPIIPYAIQGAIWYQGEANEYRGYQYRDLLPLLIRDWRNHWNKDFPFYYVQLANYKDRKREPLDSKWAELREAQFMTQRLDNTGMAVTIDLGEANDIHPKNKQDVGLRLSLIAQAKTYGKDVIFSGPTYRTYRIEGNTIRLFFDNVGNGMKVKGSSSLKGFSIAGPDHKFYWAKATIEGNEVIVNSPDVKYPVAVRYAWADNPECNLYNSADLPASPFRTDDWR